MTRQPVGRSVGFAAVYGDFVRAPLPMEKETQEDADANRQDRATPLNLDGVHDRPAPKRPKLTEELDAIFQNAARVQARQQRFPRPRW